MARNPESAGVSDSLATNFTIADESTYQTVSAFIGAQTLEDRNNLYLVPRRRAIASCERNSLDLSRIDHMV